MKDFFSALTFLTTIPFKTQTNSIAPTASSLTYFPVIGYSIGAVLSAAQALLFYIGFQNPAISAIIVVFLIFLTGGIHLDGLSDMLDGLCCGKEKEEALKIMRDPHAGAMGVIGIASAILLKFSLIAAINPRYLPLAFIFMAMLSRWSMVFLITFFPYVRQQGKAKAFMDNKSIKYFVLATIFPTAIILLSLPIEGFLSMAVCCSTAYLVAKIASSKIGGITGDILGATNEICEIAVLIVLSIL